MIIGVDDLKVHWLFKPRMRVKFLEISSLEEHAKYVRESLGGREIGIYIHIPFCKSTCMFCPYFREVIANARQLEDYLEALLHEIRTYGKLLEDRDLRVIELHVGGGTPSLVPPAFYRRLVEELSTYFDIRTSLAIEVNPEDFKNKQVVEEFYSAGVEEVSIGVQSFNKEVLKALGRKHTPEDSTKAVENALQAGFKWVNIDLMFLPPSIKGFVEMNLSDKLVAFKSDLEKAIELGVHQVTYYPTIIPMGSPGYKLVELGKLTQEGEHMGEFVKLALNTLSARGMHMVRIYSFSKKMYEYATVNLEIMGPLLGFGVSAWSNTGTYQYVNIHSINKYVEAARTGRYPVTRYRTFKSTTRAWRLFVDQMITAGRMRKDAYTLIGEKGFPVPIKLTLFLMKLLGFAEDVGDKYELTRKGIVEAYKALIDYVIRVPIYYTWYFKHLEQK